MEGLHEQTWLTSSAFATVTHTLLSLFDLSIIGMEGKMLSARESCNNVYVACACNVNAPGTGSTAIFVYPSDQCDQ